MTRRLSSSCGTPEAGRGRPRSAASHEAILGATLELLREEGYAGLTIDGIAQRAGVGKQTIYRWWKGKPEVVLEAFATYASREIPLPDKGSVQADVDAFLATSFRKLNEGAAPVVRGLMADAILDPQFGELLREVFIARRRAALKTLLQRGVERGEVAADADLELAIDMLFGPMWYRLLNRHAPLNRRFAAGLANSLMRGISADTVR